MKFVTFVIIGIILAGSWGYAASHVMMLLFGPALGALIGFVLAVAGGLVIGGFGASIYYYDEFKKEWGFHDD